MRSSALVLTLILAAGAAGARHHRAEVPAPGEFVVGRETFFDFGPPFNYYDIFVVRPDGDTTSVERITLTPATDKCYRPAKVEVARADIRESVASLLGNYNPCAIPEKDLRRELKRCKKCLVFSGADVAMQVRCGDQTRVIRSDILERDWFDPHSKIPKNTSWTVALLQRLDKALGPGVMDKPVFPQPDADVPPAAVLDPELQKNLDSGKYDGLFPRAHYKASDLFRASQLPPAVPSVKLRSVGPGAPESFVLPSYPPFARVARVHGVVGVSGIIGPDGSPILLMLDGGPKLMQASVNNAVSRWKFPTNVAGQVMHAWFEFDLTCPESEKQTK